MPTQMLTGPNQGRCCTNEKQGGRRPEAGGPGPRLRLHTSVTTEAMFSHTRETMEAFHRLYLSAAPNLLVFPQPSVFLTKCSQRMKYQASCSQARAGDLSLCLGSHPVEPEDRCDGPTNTSFQPQAPNAPMGGARRPDRSTQQLKVHTVKRQAVLKGSNWAFTPSEGGGP
ncbi:unnamed protein product [Pleuronectes platessa]|uniref:Uncharacterized protein n=1 Tax=Pleuronectes platessa TaxID=8262 RepID=A0A9N7YIH7_PLEPL|nr:unnamed protein product [Pleuronectes platessa]